METNVTELPDSRARVDVSVDAAEVDSKLKETATRLGGEMRIPGFRKGKVPPEMVLQRLGRQTVLTETLEGGALGDWYERAMLDSGVSAVGDP
jgi:trigger factor